MQHRKPGVRRHPCGQRGRASSVSHMGSLVPSEIERVTCGAGRETSLQQCAPLAKEKPIRFMSCVTRAVLDTRAPTNFCKAAFGRDGHILMNRLWKLKTPLHLKGKSEALEPEGDATENQDKSQHNSTECFCALARGDLNLSACVIVMSGKGSAASERFCA